MADEKLNTGPEAQKTEKAPAPAVADPAHGEPAVPEHRPEQAGPAEPGDAQPSKRDKMELLTKCVFIYFERKNGSKKDAHRRHPIHLIILFKFKAVAERRQWSSAASKPRRKTRVKLCPHF